MTFYRFNTAANFGAAPEGATIIDLADAAPKWTMDVADAHMLHEAAGEVVAERDRLRAILYREGYAPCSSAACNCGGWHK